MTSFAEEIHSSCRQ